MSVKDVERLEVYERGFCGYIRPRGMYGEGRLTGYDTDPDRIAQKFCAEGCLVLDKRPASDHNEYVRLVISGPLPDAFGEGSECPEPSAFVMAATAGNGYGTLLAGHMVAKKVRPSEPGPLDQIPWRDYCAAWKGLGACTGVVKSGRVIWDK